ncbi:MAG: adenylyltransferase/cytidyltransferase family protein [Phycisphaerales bacterium]|nr:adenylyltransferase/cytidyltransferase family protein [Phycisphaerales bacterium]
MPAAVLTIGNFDGVHLGHQALLARAREIAGRHGRVVALAFDPHPLTVLRPGAAPARLSTWAQRDRWLRDGGADEVVRLVPDAATLTLPPGPFVQRLVAEHAPAAIVEGADFRFGRDRAGDIRTLTSLGATHGFAVAMVEPITAALADQSVVTVSSSLVRWLVENGRARDAAALLGRPYQLAGVVVRGDRRGRAIGFPTANLESACLAPADGVYAGRAELPDGRTVPAAISVGTKPTFGPHGRTVEAFLLGVDADGSGAIRGLPEYGWPVRLELIGWVREQVSFGSVPALVGQMTRDCARIEHMIGGSVGAGTP